MYVFLTLFNYIYIKVNIKKNYTTINMTFLYINNEQFKNE